MAKGSGDVYLGQLERGKRRFGWLGSTLPTCPRYCMATHARGGFLVVLVMHTGIVCRRGRGVGQDRGEEDMNTKKQSESV